MLAKMQLFLLGPFQAKLNDEPLSGFASNKVRALLASLAVESGRPHPRPVLAALLWPGQPNRAARSLLRHALSNPRDVIGDREAVSPFLTITREAIQFDGRGDCWLDVAAFADLEGTGESDIVAVDRLREAVDLYRGRFLDGFSISDSSAFEEWQMHTRERFGRQASKALRTLALHFEDRRQYDRAQLYARRQVEIEPWCEEAHQQLMRLLALGGQRSAALAQYTNCRRLLAEELGVQTCTRYDGALREHPRWEANRNRERVSPGGPSLAVASRRRRCDFRGKPSRRRPG